MKLAVRYYSRGGSTKKIAEISNSRMLHKGRPNEADQKAAADFARGIIS